MAHDEGGRSPHVPVLVEEVLHYLRPRPGMVALDATVGAGGHAGALQRALQPGGLLIGLDRDRRILPFARRRLRGVGGRFHLSWALFSEIPAVLSRWGVRGRLDLALFDLGMSSLQLDSPRRGFSFDRDGPLDLRMGRGCAEPAHALLARLSRQGLESILREFGEEPHARRIAEAVVRERRAVPILRTRHLVRVVEGAVSGRRGRIHPATRTFQALRIVVNRELEELRQGMAHAMNELRVGGRIGVISYHSLEDRRVKQTFRAGVARAAWREVTRGVVRPSDEELGRNRRARSSRLRVLERKA